jgi:hypothetical protein
MSLLDVGKACYKCSTIDFLPITCPSCSHTFCRTHIHSHGCTLSTTEVNAQAGPSSFAKKVTCDYGTCGRARIEAIAGVVEVGGVGKQVRCSGCQGAFCTMYVLQLSTFACGRREEDRYEGGLMIDIDHRNHTHVPPHYRQTLDKMHSSNDGPRQKKS